MKGNIRSDLLVIAFDDEASAFKPGAELVRPQNEYLIRLKGAVVVTRGPEAADVQPYPAVMRYTFPTAQPARRR
ncbi:MAG: hypothetical protein Q4G25_07930, partial [Paracoccus sp. (in: a-proteobacteria)]|nr:hypothetical protein [Paracoccus sp. (in: a-proteobacteria)]